MYIFLDLHAFSSRVSFVTLSDQLCIDVRLKSLQWDEKKIPTNSNEIEPTRPGNFARWVGRFYFDFETVSRPPPLVSSRRAVSGRSEMPHRNSLNAINTTRAFPWTLSNMTPLETLGQHELTGKSVSFSCKNLFIETWLCSYVYSM